MKRKRQAPTTGLFLCLRLRYHNNARMEKKRARAGRPVKYDPEHHAPLILGLSREGLTCAEIAKYIGIHPNTVTNWAKKYPEVGVALKTGRDEADHKVTDSLYKRACGMTIKEVRKTIFKEKDGKETQKIEEFTKELPPDTTAIIYWLKNRQPEKWRDQRKVDDGPADANSAAEFLNAWKDRND